MSEGKRVVAIAIDESEFAAAALQWYVDNVKKDSDYVVLIHCPELYDLSLANYVDNVKKDNDYVVLIHCPEMYDLTMASPAVVDQLLRELTVKVQALEEKYKQKIQALNLTGKFRTGQGKPGEVVVKIADEEKAELIITGTRGLGKIRRTFLGSVSDYVIHHATVPVLVTRHK